MQKCWAYWVSLVLSPHMYGVIVLSIMTLHCRYSLEILIGSILFLSILPLAPILIDLKRGETDIFITERIKRTKYFLYTAAFYGVASIIYYLLKLFPLFILFTTYFFETIIHMLVNTHWKISIHTAGIAGPTTFLTLVIDKRLVILYILLIPVYIARKKMNAHSDAQLIGGTVLSAATTLVIVELLTSYIV